MTKHNIQLNTLKDCLQFLEWLNGDKSMQREVAKELGKRIKQNYTADFLREHTIESALSTFLGHASHFYTRLCNNPQPWAHGRESAEQICNALLECTPKFLAVMYFLWYNVDPGFEKLHGGGWKQNWTGALTGSWLYSTSGGDLDKYLYAKSGDSKHDVIPGGFTSEDKVIYNATLLDRGYPQGYSMAGDLQKIVDKKNYNYFRSVFVSSVIGESAKRPENAANSLVLARTFCDIVLGEDDKDNGGKLIAALNDGFKSHVYSSGNSICWKDLRAHCAKLRKKFDMLFGNKHFDFTGLSTNTGNLNKTELAKETANWLRTNITKVQGHFVKIEEYKTGQHLGEYFTKNLFPYGFTIYNGTRFDMRESDLQTLKKDWCDVINEFKNTSGDLDKLVRILDGRFRDSCPILPPKKPEAPPVTSPKVDTARPVATKTEATKPVATKAEATNPTATKDTEGAQNQGKKSEGAQNQGEKSEGAQNQGKKVEGAQNQGEKSEGAQNQGKKVEGAQNQGKKVEGAQNQGKKSEGAQNQGEKSEGAQNQGKKVEGAQNQGKKSEGAQNQGKKAEGAQNQGKKAEGAQNQGKKSEASPNQNNVQSEGKNSGPSVVTSTAAAPTPGDGAPGPQGPKGNKGDAGPPGSTGAPGSPGPKGDRGQQGPNGQGPQGPKGTTAQGSPKSQVVQPQQHLNPPPATPLLSTPPSASADPGPAGKVGPPGQGSPSVDTPGQQPGVSQGKGPAQPPGVSASESGTTVAQGTGQDVVQDATQQVTQNVSSVATTAAGGGTQTQTPSNNVYKCSDGYTFIEKALNEHGYCLPVNKVTRRPTFKLNNPDLQNKIDNIVPHNDLLEKSKNHQTTRNRNIPGPQPPVPPPQPTGGRTGHHSPPVDPRGRDAGDGGVDVTFLGGREMPDPYYDQVRKHRDKVDKASIDKQKVEAWNWDTKNVERRLESEKLNAERQKILADAEKEAKEIEFIKTLQQNIPELTVLRDTPTNIPQVLASIGVPVGHPIKPPKVPSPKVKSTPFQPPLDVMGQIIVDPRDKEDKKLLEQLRQHATTLVQSKTQTEVSRTSVPEKHHEMMLERAKSEFENYLYAQLPDTGMVSGNPTTNQPGSLPTMNEPTKLPSLFGNAVPDAAQKMDDEYNKNVQDAYRTLYENQKSDGEGKQKIENDLRDHFERLNTLGGEVYISRPEPPGDAKQDPLDFQIQRVHHEDRSVNDFDLDIDHDPPPLPAAEPLEPIGPSIPAVALNLEPLEYRPPPPPPKDFNSDALKLADINFCTPTWITQTPTHGSTDIPETELLPSEAPRTVKDMLTWLAGLQHQKHQETLEKCINNAFKRGDDVPSDLRLPVNDSSIAARDVLQTIHLAAVFAASVLSSVAPNWKRRASAATVERKDHDEPKDPDCCALLCHLRDYAYACYHQLAFLRSQCSRVSQQGGWQDYEYGRDVSSPKSPLQAFLTDASASMFKTHPFDPCDICLKSRVNMGFKEDHLPTPHETGKHISTILSPSCGGEDPLLTLASYLSCITRRTPRTTGELVSFFHNFGNALHKSPSQLSPLGSALSTPHENCPDWDILGDADLNAVQGIRGSAPPTANHDKGHSRTLSTLLGCGIDNANCPQHMKPITHRAYALYSKAFTHHYLGWTAYLADRLWESLEKLHYDLEKLQCHDSMSKALHQCDKALPLLYSHGFTPPDGTLHSSLTCSELITKLEEVVAGEPIAGLMTAMDTFLYRIRAPFLFCLVTLWLIATLYILHSLLYRMDVLRIRSHLLTTRASHLIDVKALLAGSRRMLSLYKDVDYFDDEFHSYFNPPKFTLPNVKAALSKFLENASGFYTRLCYNPQPWEYRAESADKIAYALLECMPKFLSVMYFLWYNVDPGFEKLDGGGWKQNWPGALKGASWWWNRNSGGDLQKYLRAQTGGEYGGLIPGGFGKDEVRCNPNVLHRGYPQGAQMAPDLANILRKSPYNFLRSVFVSSTIGDAAKRKERTANALSLVRTFCHIVGDEANDDGGQLIKKLNEGLQQQWSSRDRSICWKDLKDQCAKLEKQFGRLFAEKRFDFTGQSTDTGNLKKADFANRTADWLRTYLNTVRGKLNQIKTDNILNGHLGKYFTDNLFPYGFTLKGRFHMSHNEVKALMQDWREVIDDLKKADDGLDKLKQILDGTYRVSCPPPPPKKPEVPPAKKSEGAQNQGKKVEGAQNQGKKSEGAQNQGKKSEGAQNQGKKTEGTPNQGEPLGPTTSMSTNQNNGQGEQKFPPPPGVTSTASDTSPGDPGAPGPAGSKGDRDQQGPPVTVTPGSSPPQDTSVKQVVQTQQPGPVQPVRPLPPPTAPPSDSGLPGPAGQPGVGPGSTSVDTQGLPSGVSQGNGPPQIPSVSGQGPGPTGDQRTGPQGGGEAGKGDDLGGGQQSNRDSTQPTNKGTDHNPSNVATPSSAPVPGVGGGGKAAPAKKCVTFNLTNLLKHSNDGDTTEFCDYDYNPPAPKHYKVNDATSEQIWEEYKQREILPPIKEKLEARRREKEEEERRKEDERQLKYQSMLPEIGVLYKPRESSQNLEEAYRTAVQNKMKDAAPNVSLEITRRTGAYANNHDDGVTADVDEPLAFDIAKPDPLDLSKYVVLDIVKPDLLEEKKPVASDLYKSVALGVKGRSEADGFDNPAVAILDGQDALEDHVPVLQNPQEAEKQEMLAQQGNALTGTTTDNYQGISAFKPRPGAHPIGTFSGNALYKLDTPNAMPLNVEFTGQATPNAKGIPNSTPHGFFAAIGIPEGRPLKPANYVRALPPVSDITGKSIPDRDLNARLLPLSPIGKQPVPIMQPGKREQDVDRYQPAVIRRDLIRPKFPTIVEYIDDHPGLMIDPGICPASYGNSVLPVGRMVPPTDYSSPSPKTVREMLCWLSDLPGTPGYAALTQHIAGFFESSEIIAWPASFSDNDVMVTLSDTCGHASAVLTGIHGSKPPDLSQFHYQRYGIPLMYYSDDPYRLLCQLLNYVYAACHQLLFLRTQCSRDTHSGGWRDCKFGRDVKVSKSWQCSKSPVDPTKLKGHGCDASPLQGFLTDQSDLSTYRYRRGDICRRSRVKLGFLPDNFREESKHGFYIYQILKGLCYNADPLEKLCTYLNCLTRRTPRTTGELVSFFHNIGNELHDVSLKLSPLGSALSEPHRHCPDWDILGDADLEVIRDARGSAPASSNPDHDKGHPNTLSTLLGCGIDNANCPPRLSPITYRAYALYSSSFAHHYLSWTVYLPDRLWESLTKLHCDLEELQCHAAKPKPLHQCDKALPLLYTHGLTPPDGTLQPSLTCSQFIAKLEAVVAGQPIASLMTAMDLFLYGIREPFLFTIVALWLTATLYILHSLLYRIDVLRIRSHLLTTRASHLIDVKALLAGSRRMLSLYKDVDYFDDDFHS
ncbi:Ribosome-binding protein 1 [Babesia ovata]|uniref:Ribosome-binding protein 1 n=1 Tax=Babesia ovata TaxID=189622 RepID=A0A2H6KG45_9APIC|nr:Ribosome-binding protein 1 [Babesia ovata]GBE61968.1 Ribosome-binding protein 1 [Babesia ovata]